MIHFLHPMQLKSPRHIFSQLKEHFPTKNIFEKNYFTIFFLFCLYLFLQLFFLTQVTNVWVDEPWYASTSYNFSQGKGLVNDSAGSGGGTTAFLYTMLMGIFFKIFGTSLVSGRLFSVLGGLIGLIGVIYILKELHVRNLLVFFAGLLYISSNVNYIIFRTIRPEGWVVALIIWGFYFLIRGIKYSSTIDYLCSGLVTSCSFLCHPNAAFCVFLFGVVTVILSINRKKFSFFFYYLFGCLPVYASLVLYIVFFLEQDIITVFANWSGRTHLSSHSFLASAIQNLATFSRIYTLGVKRLLIFIFEIGILVIGLFYFKKEKFIFLTSALGLAFFISAILFLKPFFPRGFGAVLIFSFLTYALMLNISHHTSRKIQRVLTIVGIIYLLNNLAGNLYVINRDYRSTPYSYIEKRIDEIVPDKVPVLTVMNFWFPLKNNDNYNSFTIWHKKKYKSLDDLLDSGDVEYVIISNYLTTGVTATSGRKEDQETIERYTKHFAKVHNFAARNGRLVESILTNNYGKIEVWKTR